MWDLGSDQGSNLWPLKWKCGVITGQPGMSLAGVFDKIKKWIVNLLFRCDYFIMIMFLKNEFLSFRNEIKIFPREKNITGFTPNHTGEWDQGCGSINEP